MNRRSCPTYNPLCMTFVFMFGTMVGILAGHSNLQEIFLLRHGIIVSIATLVFYLTQVGFHINKFILAKIPNKVTK